MSLHARVIGAFIAAVTLLAVTGASFLVAALDGNPLVFLAVVLLLLVVSAAAFVLLAFTPAAMVAAADAADDQTEDVEAAEGLERLIVDGRLDPYGDRNGRAS